MQVPACVVQSWWVPGVKRIEATKRIGGLPVRTKALLGFRPADNPIVADAFPGPFCAPRRDAVQFQVIDR